MKTRTLSGWVLGMVLAGGVVASGFAQNGVDPSQTPVSPAKTGAAVPAPAVTTSVEPGIPSQPAPQPSTAAPALTGNTQDKSLSPIHNLSPWFYEVERLTQARVNEGVVLSYINNEAGAFNLTADQVITLKNLGASPEVISAMLEHDRELNSGERPMTASAPPPLPASVQANLAASLHTTAPASAPPPTVATPSPASSGSIIAPDDASGANGTWVWVEPDDVPDQPASAGPVRVPYAVKLNDPIVVLRLPTFALPGW